MGFLSGNQKLENAFCSESAAVAHLDDALKPHPDLPDPQTVIGLKIERSSKLHLSSGVGRLICRAVQPDIAKCAGIIPLEYFNPISNRSDPSIIMRQILEWEGEYGFHQARFAASYGDEDLEFMDRTNGMLSYRMINEPPSVRGRDLHNEASFISEDSTEHIAAIAAVAQIPDLEVAHFTQPTLVDGSGVFRAQTAAQFERHIDWLLA